MSDYIKTFELKSVGSVEALQWVAWSKTLHDPLQPINELIDNAIAAILSGHVANGKINGKIYINFDFTSNTGKIEHTGGSTFPLEISEIVRCLAYGGAKATSLNEHGCGLKTSLAILDRSNSKWKIFIKVVENGALKFYSISAPYASRMKIVPQSAWPGQDNTAQPGSLIQFPVSGAIFAGLFGKKKQQATEKELSTHFKNHLGHVWQRIPEIMNSNILLYYNGDRAEPFSFQKHGVFDEYVDLYRPKKTYELSTSGKVEVEEIKLKESKKKIPGSNVFMYAQHANGIYFFKNGRLIESVRAEDDRELYSRIFGAVPHHSHNGNIKIVNFVGSQSQIPATVPTKNRFGASELFEEAIRILTEKLTPVSNGLDDRSELEIRDKFKADRERTMLSAGILGYSIEKNKHVMVGDVLAPPIDLLEKNGARYTVMEFKKNVRPAVQDFHQLLGYWTYVRAAYPDKVVEAALYLAPSPDFKMTHENKAYLHILAKDYKFCPTIYDYDNKMLYRQDTV
jgi:hypothetical protein